MLKKIYLDLSSTGFLSFHYSVVTVKAVAGGHPFGPEESLYLGDRLIMGSYES